MGPDHIVEVVFENDTDTKSKTRGLSSTIWFKNLSNNKLNLYYDSCCSNINLGYNYKLCRKTLRMRNFKYIYKWTMLIVSYENFILSHKYIF